MRKTVLIIGQNPDPHIDRIVSLVREMGSVPVVFDRFHPNHLIELSLGQEGPSGVFNLDGQVLPFRTVDAVWWRWKPTLPGEWSGVFSKEAEEFVSREWRATLRSLPAFIPHAFWLNPLFEHFRAGLKPWQMVLAHSVGLDVPETRFTNRPEAILSFFPFCKRLIYKTVRSFIVPPDGIIYTNEIHEDDVRNSAASIREAPGTYQEMISKHFELRVTIVGQQIFSARINSQQADGTRIDWRRSQLEDMYESVELDSQLTSKLLEFHTRAGLIYGAYDLIVNQDGRNRSRVEQHEIKGFLQSRGPF
jgi:hypothetical protein